MENPAVEVMCSARLAACTDGRTCDGQAACAVGLSVCAPPPADPDPQEGHSQIQLKVGRSMSPDMMGLLRSFGLSEARWV